MATKYCVNCDRVVEAKRVIGVGTFILALITSGIWLFIIPFYSKRCPICKGTNFGKKPINKVGSDVQLKQDTTKTDPIEQIKKLQELKESGILTEDEFNEKKKNLLNTI